MSLKSWLPLLEWGASYQRQQLGADLLAACIVTVMLIPQSLAYALLAGLPPQVGLYASIFPLIAYSVLGSSSTLSVGPVAVISLMSAVAIDQLGLPSVEEKVAAAMVLSVLSGLMLLGMGCLRLGMLANFLSHPVISGFVTASAILIALSQLPYFLGVQIPADSAPTMLLALIDSLDSVNLWSLSIGSACVLVLLWIRSYLKRLLRAAGMAERGADFLTKAGPVLAVIVSTWASGHWGLAEQGVQIVGAIPAGLPGFSLPPLDLSLWRELLVSALLISIVGFVESVSVAETLAARRHQRIRPNQELLGLGAANLASGFGGGYPVTGGFSRSVVNFEAGAQTPAAGAYTAVGILAVTWFLTPLLYHLPKATLAATILLAVLALIDIKAIRRTYRYSRSDFAAMLVTIVLTLLMGVETGIAAGVILSVGLFIARTSTPHMAVVGRVEGTEHFRNIERHAVETVPQILTLRVDESLYFANVRYLEDRIEQLLQQQPDIRHLILMCPAVNQIDSSGLEALEGLNHRLSAQGIRLHLSEIKGPVMDRLQRSQFLQTLSGQVFRSQYEAWQTLKAGPGVEESGV